MHSCWIHLLEFACHFHDHQCQMTVFGMLPFIIIYWYFQWGPNGWSRVGRVSEVSHPCWIIRGWNDLLFLPPPPHPTTDMAWGTDTHVLWPHNNWHMLGSTEQCTWTLCRTTGLREWRKAIQSEAWRRWGWVIWLLMCLSERCRAYKSNSSPSRSLRVFSGRRVRANKQTSPLLVNELWG